MRQTRGMDARARLQEVIDRGGPGQAEHARTLMDRLATGTNPELERQIALLHDAYLHDPYLTRYDRQ